MCEFHGYNGNGFGDIWWTDNPIYLSSIDICSRLVADKLFGQFGMSVRDERVKLKRSGLQLSKIY